jgi:hypothetical protein
VGFMGRSFMGRSYVAQLVVLLVALSWGNVAVAGSHDRNTVQITVVVNDNAAVSGAVLHQAETVASRIFGAAGIQVAWVNCSGGVAEEACRVTAGSGQFVLHIVPTGKTSTDSVFGMAFLGQDGSGKYCDVFFDRIAEAHRSFGTDKSQLLGTVVAHEIGHLLLGSHAHSQIGIMAPVWAEENLRNISMGLLLFTREQSSLMKASLMKARTGRQDLRLAGLR